MEKRGKRSYEWVANDQRKETFFLKPSYCQLSCTLNYA